MLLAVMIAAQSPDPLAVDKAGEKWVQSTLKKLSLEEKVGQLLVSSFQSSFLSTDSDAFAALEKAVREYHVGGFHVFGATELAPPVLLNPAYGTVILGQPLEAASILNRLQAIAPISLLNTADFEGGVGFRIAGATAFPRAMAFGAIGDEASVVRSGTDYRTRSARARRPRQFRAGRRRQQQPAQSGHQHALVRRGPGGCRTTRDRLHSRHAGRRRDGDAQTLSRARRHRGRLAHRPAGHQASARAARRARVAAVQGRDRRWSSCRDDRPHRDAGARSDAGHADHAQSADRQRRAAQGAGVPRPDLHRLDGHAGRYQHARAGRSGRARRPRRQRRRAAFARRWRRAHGDRRGGEVRTDCAGADRRVGRAHPARESEGRAAQEQARCARRDCHRPSARARIRRSPTPSASARSRCSRTRAARCRSSSRATRRCCICRCSTIRRGGGLPRPAGRSSPSCASGGRT